MKRSAGGHAYRPTKLHRLDVFADPSAILCGQRLEPVPHPLISGGCPKEDRRNPLGEGLHEVRSDLSDNRTARIFFYVDRLQRMVLLHGIVKKTRKTPEADLVLARTNKRKHERSLE